MEHRRARMAGAQRIEDVDERHLVVERADAAAGQSAKVALAELAVVAVPAASRNVRDQRVQAVDRGELLGDRIRCGVVVLGRAGIPERPRWRRRGRGPVA